MGLMTLTTHGDQGEEEAPLSMHRDPTGGGFNTVDSRFKDWFESALAIWGPMTLTTR